MARMPYATDLTDEQWAMLEPLLPAAKPGGRPQSTDLREVGSHLARHGGGRRVPGRRHDRPAA